MFTLTDLVLPLIAAAPLIILVIHSAYRSRPQRQENPDATREHNKQLAYYLLLGGYSLSTDQYKLLGAHSWTEADLERFGRKDLIPLLPVIHEALGEKKQ